jgi:O-antigen/teichoic acid export membrane protein
MLFGQLGHPGWQTVFVLLGFLMNVGLNLLLIPFMGVLGAALATGAATVLTMLLHRWMAFRISGIHF